MTFLSNLRLNTKLSILISLFLISSAALVWVAGDTAKSQMMTERTHKNRALVEVAYGIVSSYAERVQKGDLSKKSAQENALADLAHIRYDNTNYFWVNDMDATMIMHPIKPKLDGKNLAKFEDPTGKKLFSEMVNVVSKEGAGFVNYKWPKPGKENPVDKISYVQGFKPWNWVIGSGIYIDDIQEDYWSIIIKLSAILIALAGVCLTISTSISIDISRSLKQLLAKMELIAHEKLDTKITETERKDEIGEMAQALEIFKQNAKDRLEIQQEQEIDRERVMRSAQNRANIAANMASSTEQVSGHVTAISAATSELSANIAEISTQVNESSVMTREATDAATETHNITKNLAEATVRIGKVLQFIRDIADQTNLLALNASIEAARAGDSGRGFAVVAEEVKKLSQETAKATDEISVHIDDIQKASNLSVESIASITEKIASVSELASILTAAMGEQHSATDDIANRMGEASDGLSAIVTQINEVQNNDMP